MSGFDRDKHLKPLLAGGIALFILLLFWGYSSYQRAFDQLERKTRSAQNELQQFQQDIQVYRQLEGEFPDTQGPAENQNLITMVENATQQAGTRNQLLYVRPQPDRTSGEVIEERVEIRLENLQLRQLVELLFQFESTQQLLKVSQLRIKSRFDNPNLLDTVMTLSRFKEQR